MYIHSSCIIIVTWCHYSIHVHVQGLNRSLPFMGLTAAVHGTDLHVHVQSREPHFMNIHCTYTCTVMCMWLLLTLSPHLAMLQSALRTISSVIVGSYLFRPLQQHHTVAQPLHGCSALISLWGLHGSSRSEVSVLLIVLDTHRSS